MQYLYYFLKDFPLIPHFRIFCIFCVLEFSIIISVFQKLICNFFLFQRVAEQKNLAIGKHFHEEHGRRDRLNESHFKILRKCQSKFDCLVFEMLYIKKFKANLNVQADSICAKLFV